MKKILFTAALCLLSVSAIGADFADSLRSGRVAMRRVMGLDTVATGLLSDEAGTFFWKEAVAHVIPIVSAIKAETQVVTVFQKWDYSIDTTFISVVHATWSANDSTRPMQYLPMSEWYKSTTPRPNNQTEASAARPLVWDYRDGVIYVDPPPFVENDTIRVYGMKRLVNLGAAVAYNSIPQQFREPVVLYASYLVARSRQMGIKDDLLNDYLFSLKRLGVQDASIAVAPSR